MDEGGWSSRTALVVVLVATSVLLSGTALLVTPPGPTSPPLSGSTVVTGATGVTGLQPQPAGSAGGSLAGSSGPGGLGATPGGLAPSDIFYPNPSTPSPLSSSGLVAPPFTSGPAPMGLSDLGVNTTGAYSYQTKSFEGVLAIQSFRALAPGYVEASPFQAPDWALLQLNAVAVNISYPGNGTGVFWFQNGVHLNGSRLQFEDNVWNFSSPGASMPSSTLHGVAGKIYRDQFYAGFAPSRSITFPFTLTLFDTMAKSGMHDVVYFNYTIRNYLGVTTSGSYDTVTFNGTASLLSPPAFRVDGSAYTPSGLLYDAELVLGGNGGGAHTNVVDLNATADLRAWNATSSAYLPIRSGYDFGADSSETAYGVAVHYLNSTATAYLGQGPSMLYGLWNTSSSTGVAPSARAGWIHVRLTTDPQYAFLFTNLSSSGYSYAPTTTAGLATADLPPPPAGSPYVFDAWADGYAPSPDVTVSDNTTGTQTIHLSTSPSTLDAPLYLLTDNQAAAFGATGTVGTGYASSGPTLWLNASSVRLAAPFLSLNVEGNPTFQLFVEQGLSTGILVNGFVQSPTTFNYTYYQGSSRYYPGWTQGYFFYGGGGRFHVGNTTLRGQPSLLAQSVPTFSAPTVEFYFTHGASADHLYASQDAQALTIVGGSSFTLANISATLGGTAVAARNSSHLNLSGISADGFDPSFRPSVAVSYSGVAHSSIVDLSVADLAQGLVSSSTTYLDLTGLEVSAGGTGVAASATGPANVTWVNVTGGLSSAGGNWSNSQELVFRHLSVGGTGFDLVNDLLVTMVNCSADGFSAGLVQSFNGSSGATFTGINATNGAIALNLTGASDIVLDTIGAESFSIAASILNTTSVTIDHVMSSINSTGVLWDGGAWANVSNVSVIAGSLGVWISNATDIAITNVTAQNLSLGDSFYFFRPGSFVNYPISAVALFNDRRATVTDVRATHYPFAVWSNLTRNLTISNVVGWYCGNVVSVNLTHVVPSHIENIFSFGSQIGVWLRDCSYLTVRTSTFEDSSILGVKVMNGSNNNVLHNDFIGNNGSSVTGTYSSNHWQAWANTTLVNFNFNYWSDWSGIGSYPINNTTDANPGPLNTYYLGFTESGLVRGSAWSFQLDDYPTYTTTLPLVDIPAWSLAKGQLPFKVLGPTGIAAHPDSGNVNWTGGTLPPIHITFGTPSQQLTLLGQPVWVVVAAIVVAAGAGLGTYLLWRRRRHPPSGRLDPLDEP